MSLASVPACDNCGAKLTLPADLLATAVRCTFCGQETMLPPPLIAERRRQHALAEAQRQQEQATSMVAEQQRSASRMRLILGLLPLAIALPIVGVVGYSIKHTVDAVQTATNTATNAATNLPAPAPAPAPTPPAPPSDAVTPDIAAAMTGKLKRLAGEGCRNIIMPPTSAVGERTLSAQFVLNGQCVRMLALTGVPANALAVSLETPLGELVDTTAPARDFDFVYCPKTAGPHRVRIAPKQEDAAYLVAAVECRKRRR
jgi:hypothetical protein